MSICRILVLGILAAAPLACITSSPAEYGVTPIAKKLSLSRCPDGQLDDLEDGDSQIFKKEGRAGYWFTSVDPEGSTVTPTGDFKPEPGGPNGSKFATHAHGKVAPSGKSLYVVIGFGLLNPRGKYDASKYKGISFWAKGPGKVRFKTPDVNTAPEGDVCTDCYNDFGVDLYLSDHWERYTVPFDRMAQEGSWGSPRPPEVTTKALIAVQWQFSSPNTEFDLWFDDIELVGCP